MQGECDFGKTGFDCGQKKRLVAHSATVGHGLDVRIAFALGLPHDFDITGMDGGFSAA